MMWIIEINALQYNLRIKIDIKSVNHLNRENE